MDTGVGIYNVEGLITTDGLLRLGLWNSDPADPGGTLQLVGHVDVGASAAHGNGVVIGEGCSVLPDNRFCANSAPAEISITWSGSPDSGNFEAPAEIQVSTSAGEESWLAVLGYWGNVAHGADYPSGVGLERVQGLYTEALADFQQAGDTTVSIDSAGRLFFQSPSSGCVGNGVLAAHLDDSSDVYDVTMTIDSCDAAHAGLNGEFEGLATHQAPITSDQSGNRLIVWLSTPEGAASPAAITMWANPTNDGCPGCWDY